MPSCTETLAGCCHRADDGTILNPSRFAIFAMNALKRLLTLILLALASVCLLPINSSAFAEAPRGYYRWTCSNGNLLAARRSKSWARQNRICPSPLSGFLHKSKLPYPSSIVSPHRSAPAPQCIDSLACHTAGGKIIGPRGLPARRACPNQSQRPARGTGAAADTNLR